MDSKVVIGIVVVLVVGLGVYAYSSNQKESAMMEQKAQEEKMMMEKQAMEKQAMEQASQSGEAMEADKMMEKDGAMMSKGSYEVYDETKLAMAETGKVVLFFKASWCPSCRALDADIKANLGAIPAGVTILEVDYDKYGELKKKYGVTMQHTMVQVDKDGNQIAKWSGSPTLAELLPNVK